MRHITILIALIIVLTGATGIVYPLMATGVSDRQIHIVAQNMAFVVASPEPSEETNPAIIVKAGQKITIILRNDDPGMLHDIVIQGLSVQVEKISFGETTRLTFTVPQQPGTYSYLCSFHPRSMRGVFIVE